MILNLSSQHRVKSVGREDIDTERSQIPFTRVLRLLRELYNLPFLVHLHDTEPEGFFDGNLHHRYGEVGPFLHMSSEHLAVVHFVDVVTGEYQHGVSPMIVDKPEVLVDGVRGTRKPSLVSAAVVRRQQTHSSPRPIETPGLTDTDMLVQAVRPILGQHTNRADT